MGDQRKIPATLPREAWVGPGGGLDGCGKSHHHRELDTNKKHLQLHNKPKNSSFPTETNLLIASQNRLLQ
jgi:hypothetical protein